MFLSVVSPVMSQVAPGSENKRRLLLRDEGLSQLSYIDLGNRQNNWYMPVPPGRDLQLVGDGKVLIGTGSGYEERDVKTGNKVKELTSFSNTISARRLSNGNTLLVGLNWQDKKGIVLAEVDGHGNTKRLINYADFNYVRLVRETPAGNFLITADTTVFEGNANGDILWRAKITSQKRPHAWQALRLNNGNTVVASGYAGNFQIFDTKGKMIATISGPEEVNPNFYAGFQVLDNGNFVVTNWQGHGPKYGASGTQLLEYTPSGKLVWSWKQDPEKFSSLQGVIVLDGLDLNHLHVENSEGKLSPVK
jgi:hypothetical protein